MNLYCVLLMTFRNFWQPFELSGRALDPFGSFLATTSNFVESCPQHKYPLGDPCGTHKFKSSEHSLNNCVQKAV